MKRQDTPKTPRIIKWICIAMLPLCTSLNTPANAVEINEIDKYKIYIHIKVMNYKEFVCINKLWTKENRLWDPYAKNPKSSAFGIPQLLKLKETNPYVQMDLGYKYLVHRYSKQGKEGPACNALAFHLRKGWY
jgi:hypothetical protein